MEASAWGGGSRLTAGSQMQGYGSLYSNSHLWKKTKKKTCFQLSLGLQLRKDRGPRALRSWAKSGLLLQFSSVAQWCLTIWDPMDCSTPGLPVHHQLPEFTQTYVHWHKGFLCSLVGKELACSAGDLGLIPGLGRSAGEGNGNPLQYSCLKNHTDRGAWWAAVHGVAKSRARLSD